MGPPSSRSSSSGARLLDGGCVRRNPSTFLGVRKKAARRMRRGVILLKLFLQLENPFPLLGVVFKGKPKGAPSFFGGLLKNDTTFDFSSVQFFFSDFSSCSSGFSSLARDHALRFVFPAAPRRARGLASVETSGMNLGTWGTESNSGENPRKGLPKRMNQRHFSFV